MTFAALFTAALVFLVLFARGLGLTSGLYMKGQADIASGTFNLASSTLKAALVTGYSPDFGSHQHWSDVSANEVSGTGYTAGGATLSGQSVTGTAANSWSTQWASGTAYQLGQIVRPTVGNGYVYRCVQAGTSGGSQPTWGTTLGETTSDNGVVWECAGTFVVQFTATSPSWANATISATGAVIYYSTGTASTSTLYAYLDFGGTITSTSATFTVTLPTNPGVGAITG